MRPTPNSTSTPTRERLGKLKDSIAAYHCKGGTERLGLKLHEMVEAGALVVREETTSRGRKVKYFSIPTIPIPPIPDIPDEDTGEDRHSDTDTSDPISPNVDDGSGNGVGGTVDNADNGSADDDTVAPSEGTGTHTPSEPATPSPVSSSGSATTPPGDDTAEGVRGQR
jgi:hypothetical protein